MRSRPTVVRLIPMVSEQRDCVLFSAGCTTGWTDWIHGELWICPGGLLRRALGVRHTLMHSFFPTVARNERPIRSFTVEEMVACLAENRRNYWIPWSDVRNADLRTLRLDLRLASGVRTFMWPPVDRDDLLKRRLVEAIPHRLTLHE